MGTQSVRHIQKKYYLGEEKNELRGEVLVCNQGNRCRERTADR